MGFEAEIDNSERNGVADNLQAEVICSICCSIFEDPMRLDCCEGHLCKKCFQNCSENSRNCPLCRKANFTAKFSRLMVTVLSQFKLFCPAEECNASVPYANFARHKETCPVLNRKPCSQCNEVFSKNDFQAHFSCFEELNKKAEADQKKIGKLESEVEEARITIEQLIATNESERREFRNEVKNLEQKVKTLENNLKIEEAKNRSGNQGGISQGAAIQGRNEELEKIKTELGVDGGAGHKVGEDGSRHGFDEEAVRRVLRGLEAGLTEVNFLERDRIAFYFLFFVSTRFSSKPKFRYEQNLEVNEAGWYFRQQTSDSRYGYGGDGFWKMTLKKNGRRVDFTTDADELNYDGVVEKSEKNLRPDANGMVKFKGSLYLVRWNVTIKK